MPSSVDQLQTSNRFVSGTQKTTSDEELNVSSSSSHIYMDGNDIIKVAVDLTEDVTEHLNETSCFKITAQIPDTTSDECALNNNLENLPNVTENNGIETKTNGKAKKKVRFDGLLSEEIDIDFRQLGFNCWSGVPKLTKQEILSEYRAICSERHVDVDDAIVNQLSVVQNNTDFSMMLNLLDTRITFDKLDIYEKLFQILNFRKLFINVNLLENDSIIEIFHMIEYYNSVKELILYGDYVEDSGLWSSIAVAASNSNNDLNNISIHELMITDGGLMSIFNSINENPNIHIVCFNGCKLNFTPTFSIATPLKHNRYLKELHLCNAELYYKETTILALLIRDNFSLKVLNLSNNKIGDRGFKVLVKALAEQTHDDVGIAIFMVVNNRLTKAISSSVVTIMEQCPLLQALNLGCNNLTDEFIIEIKNTLMLCTTLQAMGLQSTLLTHDGLIHLMEVCCTNKILQHLNLKGNRSLQHDALNTVVTQLPHTNLHQVDLDDANRFCTNAVQYIEILNNIRKLLLIKSTNKSVNAEKYKNFGLDQSLSCDIDYIPRSSWRSPRNKGRFEIVSVSEINSPPAPTTTTPSPSSSDGIGKEIVNWSPACSSQKTTWVQMKSLENCNEEESGTSNNPAVPVTSTVRCRKSLNYNHGAEQKNESGSTHSDNVLPIKQAETNLTTLKVTDWDEISTTTVLQF